MAASESATGSPRRTPWLLIAALLIILAGCSDDDGDDVNESASVPQVQVNLGAGVDATTLAIVGDAGERSDDTLAVAAMIASADPDAVFTVGDNEYTTEGRTVGSFEESVGQVYGQWVDSGRFYPIPGDHDYGDQCDDLDEPADLDAYLEYFELPRGPEDETYYDVRVGDIHVFALDSLEACHRDDGAKLARQQTWLAETSSASDALMKIVLLHNPPYSSGVSHGSVESLRWPFDEYGIDVVISGDDHIYERSTHDGVVYLVNGVGGIELHELGDPIDGSEFLYAEEFGAVFIVADPSIGEAYVAFQSIAGATIDKVTIELDTGSTAVPAADAAATGRTELAVGMSWQWQLQGELDTTYDVDVYDIDLFDTSAEKIAELRGDGRIVICYFSAGSFEEWRADASSFAVSTIGETLDGWEDERWLDIRDPSARAAMAARLDLAKSKGCHGVEPDNVTAKNNDTGFDITATDQLSFNRFLAEAAHERGLLIGLKNDLDQIPELVDHFDFAVNEECFQYEECNVYAAFLDAGKPVFNAEYDASYVQDPEPLCALSRSLGLSTLILDVELDGSFRIEC